MEPSICSECQSKYKTQNALAGYRSLGGFLQVFSGAFPLFQALPPFDSALDKMSFAGDSGARLELEQTSL